jgi:Protein of unknown function (DUF3467)
MTLSHLSPFDITILFQKASEVVPGQMGVMDQVAVTFSPQHFKALVKSLSETLQAYETAFGALTISDADIAPMRNAAEIVAILQAVKAKTHPNPSSTEPKPRAKRSRAAAPK